MPNCAQAGEIERSVGLSSAKVVKFTHEKALREESGRRLALEVGDDVGDDLFWVGLDEKVEVPKS